LSIYRRLLQAGLLVSVLMTPHHTLAEDQLPDIGTAGVSAISIEQERLYGEAFMRFARASLPMVDDPVLNEYLSGLGQRLVSQASDVRFPFTFFLVRDNSINAAAFLGGRVKVHTGLFLYADNESELAGVLAHEISHVTQRHIARYMEAQSRSTPLTLAGLAGSIALAIINPTAGIAAMQATLGIQMQSAINYTRDNEFEADRIGMGLLYNAGFDPKGMGSFFEKLAAQSRYDSKVPEMLLTHPLPETRIAEARNRASNYPRRTAADNIDFYFAKARIQVRYSKLDLNGLYDEYTKRLKQPGTEQQMAARYGQALIRLAQNKPGEAASLLSELARRYPDDLFILDSLTDMDVANKQYGSAIQRLQKRLVEMPDNEVVVFNLAGALMEAGRAQEAEQLLERFTRSHTEQDLAWRMLADAAQQTGNRSQLFTARAEYFALRSDYQKATDDLNTARASTNDKMTQARIDARIAQLQAAKQLDDSLKR